MHLRKIDTLVHFDRDEFLDTWFKSQRPVLIKGFARHWDAGHKWNYDYLKKVAGEIVVPLYDDSKVMANASVNKAAREMKLAEYLDLIAAEPTNLRIFLFNIFRQVPQLCNDFPIPDFPGILRSYPMMFFGGKNSKVFPHYDIDLSHVFHVHFKGRKRALLFSQEYNTQLYRLPFSVYNHEDIDLDNPDLERFPALKQLEGYEAYLENGDLLYMPSGWWHFMHYLEDGFSLSLRAVDRSVMTLCSAAYHMVVMRNIDNLGRKCFGEKWLKYKDRKAIEKATLLLRKAS